MEPSNVITFINRTRDTRHILNVMQRTIKKRLRSKISFYSCRHRVFAVIQDKKNKVIAAHTLSK
jgi:hypothetical protein